MDDKSNVETAINFSAMKAEHEQHQESIEQADSTSRLLGVVLLFVLLCGALSILVAVGIAIVNK